MDSTVNTNSEYDTYIRNYMENQGVDFTKYVISADASGPNVIALTATEPHPDQDIEGVIGLDKNGNLVDMDMWMWDYGWDYELQDYSTETYDLYNTANYDIEDWGENYENLLPAYTGEIKDGKILSEVPAYIKWTTEGDTYFKPVTGTYDIFANCSELEVAPAIPNTIEYMEGTFINCISLTGTLRINSKNVSIFFDSFYGVEKPLTVQVYGGSVTHQAINARYGDAENITIETIGSLETVDYKGQKVDMSLWKLVAIFNPSGDGYIYGVTYIGPVKNGKIQSEIPQFISYDGGEKIPILSIRNAFENMTDLEESPIIPNTIEYMDETFYGCTSLKETPTIPEGVTGITSAFKNCTSLEKITTIPSSITHMANAFKNCTSLTEMPVIPEGVVYMHATFSGCTSLEKVTTIPSSVYSISEIFMNCTSLKEAPTILEGVTKMEKTFYGCTSLEEAPEIPEGVTDMYQTFYGCTNLTKASTIPSTATKVINTYGNCWNLAGTLKILSKNIEANNATGFLSYKTYMAVPAVRITIQVPANSTTYTTMVAQFENAVDVEIETFE